MLLSYIYLALAIVAEIFGTTFLKASEGFTRLGYSILSFILLFFCFYIFSLALKNINLSIAYALWSGIGIIATSIIGVVFWHEKIDLPTLIGIGLILLGVIVVNLFGSASE